MKEKKHILLLPVLFFLFILTTNVYPQSGWFWQHPYPQGDYIHDNYFINKNTGWVITEHQILKTTNGGLNWSINSNPDWQFESVFFIDEYTGWVGGLRNLYKSTNGGNNWTTLTITYYGDYLFKDLVFLNSQTGLTLTKDAIYKTTNGGLNWSLKMQNTYDQLSSFSFINGLTGWVSSDSGKIYKTTNGGNNWFKQASGINTTLNKVKFVDSLNGYACGQNSTLLRSTNGGNNWQISTVGAFNNLLDCEFYNENTGWVTYSKTWETGGIFKTTNGGAHWDTTSTINALYKITMLDSANLFASGFGIAKTTNGESWNSVSFGRTNWLYASSFINENTGWAAGGNVYSNYSSLLLKTTNGGTDWIEFPNFSSTPIKSIYFINENTGWAAGDNGKLLKSTNGGYNWQNIVTPTSNNITNIYFSDSINGWLTCGYQNSAAIFSSSMEV